MREFLKGIEIQSWNVASVVLFTLFFVAMVWWVYSPRRRGYYEEISHLPEEDATGTPNK